MAVISIYPLGTPTPRKDGTIMIQAPHPTQQLLAQYKMDYYPHALQGLTDVQLDVNYSGRFDDPRYYAGDSPL